MTNRYGLDVTYEDMAGVKAPFEEKHYFTDNKPIDRLKLIEEFRQVFANRFDVPSEASFDGMPLAMKVLNQGEVIRALVNLGFEAFEFFPEGQDEFYASTATDRHREITRYHDFRRSKYANTVRSTDEQEEIEST